MEEKKYGLFTSVTMITGVVIGSGIFFKSDDILGYTNGNVLLGVLVFVIAAMAIIFGCLTISVLALKTDKAGGIVSYASEFINGRIASAFGWFQLLLYFPTLVAVVSWIVGMYTVMLMGWKASNGLYSIIGAIVIVVLLVFQVISTKIGAGIQNASMMIKIIPLLLIAVIGLICGNPREGLLRDKETFSSVAKSTGWLTAFAPIAFSFDGWIVATSICHEIKNSKRNLPIALILAPILILVSYILYFVGITTLVGADQVLAQGNDSAYTAATMILGPFGAKLLLVFILISVLGTVNGLIIGYAQMPYSLAIRGMLPLNRTFLKQPKNKNGVATSGVCLVLFISLFWLVMHYFTQKVNMPGDVSEIAICFSYLNYTVLYYTVFRLTLRGKAKGKFLGIVSPTFATLGSIIILAGSVAHPLFLVYMLICLVIMISGYLYFVLTNKGQIDKMC